MKFTRTYVACIGKIVWTAATSPDGVHSPRNYHLEEYAPPGDVGTVHSVFPIHTTHVLVNFSPFFLQKLALLCCLSHDDDSNMHAIFVA